MRKKGKKRKKYKNKKQKRNVNTAVQDTREKKSQCKAEKVILQNVEGNTPSFFYDVLILIVSLLHGTLFFYISR